jgi:hypothetical protein
MLSFTFKCVTINDLTKRNFPLNSRLGRVAHPMPICRPLFVSRMGCRAPYPLPCVRVTGERERFAV